MQKSAGVLVYLRDVDDLDQDELVQMEGSRNVLEVKSKGLADGSPVRLGEKNSYPWSNGVDHGATRGQR